LSYVGLALASDTEYRLREIIQEAMKVKKKKKKKKKIKLRLFIFYLFFKFMKHSKRDKLTPADINSALRLRHVEQLFGTISPTYHIISSPHFIASQ
jgi:transcription initiation factor TFIID subunit 6